MTRTHAGFTFNWDRSPSQRQKAGARPNLPSLEGRHVYLRPVQPGDYGTLQALETRGEAALRWRYRGQTPSPEQWLGNLWNGVLAQFLVVSRDSNAPVGFIYAYKTSLQDRHTYLAAMKFDLGDRSALMMMGITMFVEYLFRCWDFKVLYMEVPEFNYDQFASGEGRFFTVEGCLKDNYACDGRWWDLLILAVHREHWARAGKPLLAAALGEPARPVTLRVPHQEAP
jgi:hypothetical protein